MGRSQPVFPCKDTVPCASYTLLNILSLSSSSLLFSWWDQRPHRVTKVPEVGVFYGHRFLWSPETSQEVTLNRKWIWGHVNMTQNLPLLLWSGRELARYSKTWKVVSYQTPNSCFLFNQLLHFCVLTAPTISDLDKLGLLGNLFRNCAVHQACGNSC